MFEVVRKDWNSILSGKHTVWVVQTRRGIKYGEYQQAGVANTIAATLNKEMCG